MSPYAAEPVRRVPIVRFTPMHNPVHEGAVGIVHALGNGVGRIQMIMPEKNQSPSQLLSLSGKARSFPLKHCVQG